MLLQSRAESGAEKESMGERASIPNDSTYINYEEDDDFVDDTFEATERARASVGDAGDVDSMTYSSGRTFPIPCVALYDFQVRFRFTHFTKLYSWYL